ncbi:hypothetical protein ARMSODRAFT_885009, partial [Armillaria solidipes]
MLTQEIPLWHHTGFMDSKQKQYGAKVYRCLMDNHKVEMTGEGEDIARWLNSPTHKNRKDCKCMNCSDDRTDKCCNNSHKCAITAKGLLDRLNKKWDSRWPDQEDGLELTINDHVKNQEARESNEMIQFDPEIDSKSQLSDGFCIFTSDWDTCTIPADRYPKADSDNDNEDEISTAYTDGSAFNNGTAEVRAGAGVWFGPDDECNITIRLPDLYQTNNVAEIHTV